MKKFKTKISFSSLILLICRKNKERFELVNKNLIYWQKMLQKKFTDRFFTPSTSPNPRRYRFATVHSTHVLFMFSFLIFFTHSGLQDNAPWPILNLFFVDSIISSDHHVHIILNPAPYQTIQIRLFSLVKNIFIK